MRESLKLLLLQEWTNFNQKRNSSRGLNECVLDFMYHIS
jgi:hypothetical protein